MAYPTSPLFPSLSSPFHLPLIMPLDAPHRLLQAVRPAVLVVWVKKFVLMEYNHCPAFWILRIVQIPIVPRVLRPDCQIINIFGYNEEILRIQTLKFFITKHRHPPSRKTMLPKPAPPRRLPVEHPCPQNTSSESLQAISLSENVSSPLISGNKPVIAG